MNTTPATFLYAAILALIFVGLTVRVIKQRIGTRVLLGDGGHHALNVAVRTHGNFIEYVPLALLLLMGVEARGYLPSLVHALGILLVAARVCHVFGMAMKKGAGVGRPLGTIVTLGVMSACAVMILLASF